MLTERTVADLRAAAMWRKYLRETPMSPEDKEKLRGLRLCGSSLIKQMGAEPAVFVLRAKYNDHDDTAHFFGTIRCHSAWACPYCTARVMAEKSVRIAAALDALENQNQWATMITFTMPHTYKMSCAETFTILKESWRMFVRGANRGYRYKKHTRADGTTTTYKIRHSEYGAFREDLRIRHCVRVYEFTHGRNSWHPHIHALFWIPKENFQKVTDYEQRLNKKWMHCLEFCAKKYWTTKNPNETTEEIQARADELFRANNRDKHPGLTISKDANGNPLHVTSSAYISGWRANQEMTRTDLKTARRGNLSIHQIIEKALHAESAQERDSYLFLFKEYALATRKSRRVEISNSGLNKIIDAWLKNHPEIKYIEKKNMEPVTIELVCWFNENQWWYISNCIEREVYDIKAQILERARLPDGKTQVEQLLLDHGLDIRNNHRHSLENLICSIFDNTAEKIA